MTADTLRNSGCLPTGSASSARGGKPALPVHDRPPVLDGVNADGIGIERVPVRDSGTPLSSSLRGTARLPSVQGNPISRQESGERFFQRNAGIVMRAILRPRARNAYSGQWARNFGGRLTGCRPVHCPECLGARIVIHRAVHNAPAVATPKTIDSAESVGCFQTSGRFSRSARLGKPVSGLYPGILNSGAITAFAFFVKLMRIFLIG